MDPPGESSVEAGSVVAAATPASALQRSGERLVDGADGLGASGTLMWAALGFARRDGIRGAVAGPSASADSSSGVGTQRIWLFGNGTAEHPDGGILIGNGYSWTAESCSGG